MGPRVKAFFDEETFTVSYAVSEPEGGRAAIIDRAVAEKSRAGRNANCALVRVSRARGVLGFDLRATNRAGSGPRHFGPPKND